PSRGVDQHMLYSCGCAHVRSIPGMKSTPPIPFWQRDSFSLFIEPGIGNMIALHTSIFRFHGKIDRHLHLPGSFEADSKAVCSLYSFNTLYRVINGLRCLPPLIKEPIKVHLRKLNNRRFKVLEIRMGKLPLV